MVLVEILSFKNELEKQIEIIREQIRINNEKQRIIRSKLNLNASSQNVKYLKLPLISDSKYKEPFIGKSDKKEVFHEVHTTKGRRQIKTTQKWISIIDNVDKSPWNERKKELLLSLKHKDWNWDEISEILGKTASECAFTYCEIKEKQRPSIKWTPEWDKILLDLVRRHGEKDMHWITKEFHKKTQTTLLNQEQISYRYHYMLRPDIQRGAWTPEEDFILIVALRLLELKDKKHLIFKQLAELMKNKRTDAQIRGRMKALRKRIPNLPYLRTKTPAKQKTKINSSIQIEPHKIATVCIEEDKKALENSEKKGYIIKIKPESIERDTDIQANSTKPQLQKKKKRKKFDLPPRPSKRRKI